MEEKDQAAVSQSKGSQRVPWPLDYPCMAPAGSTSTLAIAHPVGEFRHGVMDFGACFGVDHGFEEFAVRQEFPTPISDRRFLTGSDYVRNMSAMAPMINPDSASSESGEHGIARQTNCPKAANWLWRPWYAKLWWTGIAVYWAGNAATFAIPALDDFYTNALAGFLNIVFFPPMALMVLGLGFAREWFEWSDWEFVEPTHEQMFPKRSVGGMRDPASDPLDPRSGLHWQRFHRHR